MIDFGDPRLLIGLVVVLLLFGGPKFPELMRGVKRGIEEFKEGIDQGRGGGPGPTGFA